MHLGSRRSYALPHIPELGATAEREVDRALGALAGNAGAGVDHNRPCASVCLAARAAEPLEFRLFDSRHVGKARTRLR